MNRVRNWLLLINPDRDQTCTAVCSQKQAGVMKQLEFIMDGHGVDISPITPEGVSASVYECLCCNTIVIFLGAAG